MSTQSKDQPVPNVAKLVKDATDVDFLTMVRSAVHAVLAPLASLKLTVFLLSLAVFVIWVITLEQARADIWTVKSKHFPSLFVYVPFQTFFPPAWFGQLQDIPGGFYMPSGTLILVMMIVNLLSAHLIRMRVQATGGRLRLGIFGVMVGIIFTWLVIFYGPDSLAPEQASLFYQKMWLVMQVGMLGLVVAGVVGMFALDRKRNIERVGLGTFAFLILCVLIFVFVMGKDGFVGDSAMRILWQLIQATIAALLLLVGCIMIFKRKGGMVLIHFGIGMLMFNELYVTMTNVEQQMTIVEGEKTSTTQDIRTTELMVLHENAEGKHEIVTVPRDEFLKDQTISHPTLPFEIECIEYFPNSELENAPRGGNVATHGCGLIKTPRELAVSNGVGASQAVDVAAGYFRFVDKQAEKELGIYMASQESYLQGIYDEIECDGKTYYIGLRFKEYYKPYTIHLTDVKRELYVGTSVPKWFSSDFILTDHNLGQSNKKRIWMNNPLRRADETFYQSGYADLGDRERSTIQIVKNNGWMIPYVACMIVVVGLFAQFGATLLKFLEKTQGKQKQKPFVATLVGDVPVNKKSPRENWAWIPLALVVVVGACVGIKASKAGRATVVKDEMRIDLWGQIPVTHKGRIQPLESVARNLVLQLSNREEVQYPVDEKGNELGSSKAVLTSDDSSVKESDAEPEKTASEATEQYESPGDEEEAETAVPTVKRSAIRWVADMVYETNGFEDVQILRIEDLSVAAALGLPKHRKGLKYTIAELAEAREELGRLLAEADGNKPLLDSIGNILELEPTATNNDLAKMLGLEIERVEELRKLNPEKPYTLLQERLGDVQRKLNMVYGLRLALQNTFIQEGDILQGLKSASLMATSEIVPRSVHVGGEEWIPHSLAGCRIWLSKFAEARGIRGVGEFVREAAHAEMGLPPRATLIFDEMTRDAKFNKLLTEANPKSLEDLKALMDKEGVSATQLAKKAEAIVDDRLASIFKEAPDQLERLKSLENQIAGMLRTVNGEGSRIKDFASEDYELLSTLEWAYLKADHETFNSTLETYLARMESNPPVGMRASAMKSEKFYNFFSPFYMATILYLFAIFFTLFGWIGFPSMTRASFWVIGIGLFVHVLGLILRIHISGRPPVTNLYSSFLFVSAGCVAVMMVVERMTKLGIGNVLAGTVGASALLWAWSIAIGSGDTFAVLLAVLDTQFWLTTHVICISLGYTATLAAGLIGIAFLVGSNFVSSFDKEVRRSFSEIMYGIVCFGLLLSFFGTVLGGLWGDDSWGRFWGWDPKENGALMIVFWNAIVLHARWGGMIRERGLAGLSVLGIVVVLWSWEGVNQLGVGLHTYGFNEGKLMKVITLAAVMVLVAGLALIPKNKWPSVRRQG